jgi:endonuclease/exonuclease/phosphatase family metal-dependent hydrolase
MPKEFFHKTVKVLLVAVNILIAAFFCIGCYAKYFPPDHWWFVGFFTLASFYLFIILLIFFFIWLFARSRSSIFFIIIVIATLKPINNIIPFRFSSSFSIAKQPNSLRVMSWNVESFRILDYKTHPEEKQQMINLINQYKPDIACFQEMSCADSSKTAFYQLRDFVDSLHFPYYYYSYDIGDDYYPRTHTHYGKIIFSRVPLINKTTVKHYPNDYNFTFQYSDVVINNDTLRIFNCHLQTMKLTDDNLNYIDSFSLHQYNKIKESEGILTKLKHSFPKRQEQSTYVKSELNKSPYPVILCGDFNDVPNSYAYETVGSGLQNAFEKKGVGFGRTFSDILPTLRIDNIIVDKKLTVLQFIRIKKKLSDHYPIITDISLPRN